MSMLRPLLFTRLRCPPRRNRSPWPPRTAASFWNARALWGFLRDPGLSCFAGNWLLPLLLGLVSAVLLPGCARFTPEPLSPAKTADAFDERSLQNPELRAFVQNASTNSADSWPPPEWDFEQLSLVAFFYHPELALARAQLGISEAGEKTAAQRPNPTAAVAPSYNTTTAMASPWLLVASLDVPIETAGKRGYRQAQAAHLSEAARLSVAATAWQVRARVRAALLDLIAAQRKTALLQAQLEIQQEIVHRMEQQFEAGAVAQFELSPARIAASRAKVDLADLQRQEIDARSRLAEALGLPSRAVKDARISPAPFTRLDARELFTAEVRREALHSRADIFAGLETYAASESALQLEIARQYPDVHWQPGYEFDQGDNKWGPFGFTIELPVMHQNQGAIGEAMARRNEAAEKFKALQARVIAELDRAVANWRSTGTNVAVINELLSQQRERATRLEQQVTAGAAERLELLNAQLEVRVIELAALDNQIKLQQAVGALEDAVQRPLNLSPALLQTNAK
jgi:outer membrane protein, heavy metal efflux system